MSKNVIASLNEWNCERRTNRQFGRIAIWPRDRSSGGLIAGFQKPAVHADRCDESRVRVEEDWRPQPVPPKPDAMARCQLVAFDGTEAECRVFVDGYELPRVSFPAWVLKRKGLEVGSRFIWLMRDAARVRLADIDTEVSQCEDMSPAEKARLEELYEAFRRRRTEDGGEWPEFTGSGR